MKAVDKIERYLNARKTPATVRQIADYFLLTETTVGHALRELEELKLASRANVGGRSLWTSYRRPVGHVAVPQARGQVSSYPHARGYDD